MFVICNEYHKSFILKPRNKGFDNLYILDLSTAFDKQMM